MTNKHIDVIKNSLQYDAPLERHHARPTQQACVWSCARSLEILQVSAGCRVAGPPVGIYF